MAKVTKPRLGTSKTARRREELRRTLPRRTLDLASLIQQPQFVYTAVIALAFLAVTAAIVIRARAQIKVYDGQIMTETRVKRLDYQVENLTQTRQERDSALERAPDVYLLNVADLEALRQRFLNLPVIVAEQPDLEHIKPTVREYDLDKASARALAAYASDGAPDGQWKAFVDQLLTETLPGRPLIPMKEWLEGLQQPESPLLRTREGRELANWRDDAIRIRDGEQEELKRELEHVVLGAGFPRAVARYVAAGVAFNAKPTYVLNDDATTALADERVAAVEPVLIEHHKGDVIYSRGQVLEGDQLKELRAEDREFAANATAAQRWLPRLGVMGLAFLITTFLFGYIAVFYPQIARNPLRLLALCGLIAGMLALAASVGAAEPKLMYLAVVAPTVFVAIVGLLAYDQRIALFLSATQAALATLALEQGIGMFLLLFVGCGTAVAQLREMRHRSTLIQASAITGLVLVAGTILVDVIEMPMVPGFWGQIRYHGFLAGLGGFGVGFVVLGILPGLERWFDITTGMTLAELRDPKQPLLKQLQQKAPGTYNHSLQVANIAEAAAAAIGADGLLVYVGSLYHDIGKMNKPEYFVENQTDGNSKHAKLSPAMSLLVIVGHVKDGIELAREYGLPRQILHFVASHHGTTLVEYFYHAAKTQAESDDRSTVQEIEFRYPGPKPRTREAAILMLADAVESATRSMAEPNPARIESLIRQLSRKRLTDGQFDQCDLTFRELGLIEESAIKSVCAIYHGRISYPGQRQAEEADESVAKPMSA